MPKEIAVNHYEVLQVSPSAEPETIHRVYRMLAQRYHPDNNETGDEGRFRTITDAYAVLSDPERRARYDVAHLQRREGNLRLMSAAAQAENDFEMEQIVRLAVLEVLYTKRRLEPQSPGLGLLEMEELIDRPREHLEFTFWFLRLKKFVVSDDGAHMALTVEGAEYLEQNYRAVRQMKRLQAADGVG